MRYYGGLLYVLNRIPQDNVQVIDPAHGYTTLHQFSLGNGANPSDIAFVSPTKAYVSCYGTAGLLVVNPQTEALLDTIPLGGFADSDGIPEMDHMIRVGNRLFVALQRLTNFQPGNPSMVAVIDVSADTVVDADPALPGTQAIPLATRNPATSFAYDAASGHLLLGCTGSYGDQNGSVEVIDPVGLTRVGSAVTASTLGGDILDVAWDGALRSYAIVSDDLFNTCLVAWNGADGTLIGPISCPGGFSLADCAVDDRGELYLANNNFTGPGVFVYSTSNGALLAGPLDTGLPPNAIAFDLADDAPLEVAPGGVAAAELSAPWPNPARTRAHLALRLTERGRVTVEAFDLAGRRVRTLWSGERAPGNLELAWDLRDESGRPVPSGVYVMLARAGRRQAERRVIVLR
jgi:DNA-binding beta-propeller fold protein YncE